jgi:hypothetical protein
MNETPDWRAELLIQFNHHTRPSTKGDGSHRVPDNDDYGPDRSKMRVINDGMDEVKTVAQVKWFLENDAWEQHVYTTCEVPGCVNHLALADVPKDEELLALVQSDNKVSLAQLYQRGRQKGLISARSSGY